MNFIYKNEIIDYDYFNSNHKNTILFLHGWGCNKNSFASTISLLKHNYNILTLTMPTSQNTSLVWNLFDYKNLILNILHCHNITQVSIVCHSFGFRVACALNKFIEIKKLIITGGAGPKKFSIFNKTSLKNNKILLRNAKFSYIYKKIASKDYLNLSLTNKETFKNIVNFEDRRINCLCNIQKLLEQYLEIKTIKKHNLMMR